MAARSWFGYGALALVLALSLAACSDSNPESPAQTSLVSGTVVFAQSGAPAPGVSVDLERCAGLSGMMRSQLWNHSASMMTDSNGHFRFQYMHESMHRYRVLVHGTSDPQGMCYIDGTDEQSIVLRTP